jgi:hypothetical protein
MINQNNVSKWSDMSPHMISQDNVSKWSDMSTHMISQDNVSKWSDMSTHMISQDNVSKWSHVLHITSVFASKPATEQILDVLMTLWLITLKSLF